VVVVVVVVAPAPAPAPAAMPPVAAAAAVAVAVAVVVRSPAVAPTPAVASTSAAKTEPSLDSWCRLLRLQWVRPLMRYGILRLSCFLLYRLQYCCYRPRYRLRF